MSGSSARVNAIMAINSVDTTCEPLDFSKTPVTELYGENVFNDEVMSIMLPKDVYKSLKSTIENGTKLDASIADTVASAMKAWAIKKGATHYTHVFFPLTGATAEKHDSFIKPDGKGGAFTDFSGKNLIQGEPDASSFPNGGLRATFEARGYTAWDVTSPAYIYENSNGTTLCIPTAFVSWTGEALDKKTPVLRSGDALNIEAQRLLKIFGHNEVARVVSNAGCEQEYFLVDSNFFYARPDLVNTGRVLVGALSPKGQEFDDHYFGAIDDRVLSFMQDAERELYRLGIPATTRHNEVAPGQFELAPLFEQSNLATDHQQMIMTVLKSVAKKHGMACLTHEKPFAGINGSGKHLNFSISNNTQGNLYNPGDTPSENAQFLTVVAATIKAVDMHADILRATAACASNDHRLGANEAPPAIISIFLGQQLFDILDEIKNGKHATAKKSDIMNIGVDSLPKFVKDSGDRNRTSPFAFTGNRFEFRAVGSSQSVGGPITALNTMMAESFKYCSDELEKMISGGKDLNTAVESLLQTIMNDHGRVVFNGDGYSDDWHKEAAKRGLPNMKTTVDALPAYTTKKAIELFGKFNVFSEAELRSREEIYLEQYALSIAVEARTCVEMSKTVILPSAIRYQTEIAQSVAALKAAGVEADLDQLYQLVGLVKDFKAAIANLEVAHAAINSQKVDAITEARLYCDNIIPAMEAVRVVSDKLEAIIADNLWLLPTYEEMLFIK